MKSPLITLAAIGMIATSAPAFAGDREVAYRDLNLTSIEGQEALERRIEYAAEKVCGYRELKTGTRIASQDMKRCFAKAKASASKQMAAIVDDERLGG